MSRTARKHSSLARRSKWLAPVSLFAIVLLLVGATIAGFAVQHTRALNADKHKFVQAETDISALTQAIVAKTGQPLKVNTNKFCSRPSVEFGKGPLSCDVETLLFYGADSVSTAIRVYEQVSTSAQKKWQQTGVQYSNNLSSNQTFGAINKDTYIYNKDYQRIAEDYRERNAELPCNIIYTFYEASYPPSNDYIQSTNSAFILMVRIYCSDASVGQYYPYNR